MFPVHQSIQFGDRSFDVTIAATAHFINSRKSSLPEFVAGSLIAVVIVLVCLVSTVALAVVVREKGRSERRVLLERHKQAVAAASKEAHERTIAYACHQLRYYPLLKLRFICLLVARSLSGGAFTMFAFVSWGVGLQEPIACRRWCRSVHHGGHSVH